MGSKVLLGLIIGFLAGGATKALATAKAYPGYGPERQEWITFSTGSTQLIAILWIAYTFGTYSAKFGFMAIAEVIVGAILSGFIPHSSRLVIAGIALPASIAAWIIL
jgi:hypothetical protein